MFLKRKVKTFCIWPEWSTGVYTKVVAVGVGRGQPSSWDAKGHFDGTDWTGWHPDMGTEIRRVTSDILP